jgi:hypothetical protein
MSCFRLDLRALIGRPMENSKINNHCAASQLIRLGFCWDEGLAFLFNFLFKALNHFVIGFPLLCFLTVFIFLAMIPYWATMTCRLTNNVRFYSPLWFSSAICDMGFEHTLSYTATLAMKTSMQHIPHTCSIFRNGTVSSHKEKTYLSWRAKYLSRTISRALILDLA